ncbi:MAG: MlaE family ABC transporter permease [Planctomycetota bacterium]
MVAATGAPVIKALRYAGGLSYLLADTATWTFRGLFAPNVQLGRPALAAQMVRVGVRSLGIIVLVQVFIGVVLALQMAPPLKTFGQEATISDIIGVAGFRMLAPIFTGIILSGFAGASIAAELGTMVVAEEIEAMQAMAMNPVRHLVVPRVVATSTMTVLLSAVSNMMIALGGYLTARLALGPEVWYVYWERMADILKYRDLVTGLVQAGVFGVLISAIACYEGLSVRGGAEGVGRATTMTVVYSIVAIIAAACVCTMIFYTFGL